MSEEVLRRILKRITDASEVHMKESNCLFTCVLTAMIAKSVNQDCDVYGGFIVVDGATTLRHAWIQVGKNVFETNSQVLEDYMAGSVKYFYQDNNYSTSVSDEKSLILESMFLAGKSSSDPRKVSEYGDVIAIALHHLEGSKEVMEHAQSFVL